jgi:peptidoglycan-associated lipoprotein
VHFAYDSATLDGQARQQLENDASCVKRSKGEVDVTGMTDPRGTEEYNLALGEKRADTVTSYLSHLGVDRSRLAPRSLGEEYAKGTDDVGWAQDRRADLYLH